MIIIVTVSIIFFVVVALYPWAKDYIKYFHEYDGAKIKFKDLKNLINVLPEENVELYINCIIIHGYGGRVSINLSFIGYIQYRIYLVLCAEREYKKEQRERKKSQKEELLNLIDIVEDTSKQLNIEKEVKSVVQNLKKFYKK